MPRARPAAAPASSRARPLPETATPLMKNGTTAAAVMNGRSSRSGPTLRWPRSLNKTAARMTRLRIQTLASTSNSLVRRLADVCHARKTAVGAASARGLIRGGAPRDRVETAASTRNQPRVNPAGPGASVPWRATVIAAAAGRKRQVRSKDVFGFATRTDAVTGARVVNVTRVLDLIRAVGLVVVLITVSLASPRPGTDDPREVAITVALVLSAAGWVAWMLSDRIEWLTVGSLVVMGGAGGVLA